MRILVSFENILSISETCSNMAASISHQSPFFCPFKIKSQIVEFGLDALFFHGSYKSPSCRNPVGVNASRAVEKKSSNVEFSPHSRSKPFPMISSWCHEDFASPLALEYFVSVFSEGLVKFHYFHVRTGGELARSCSIAAGCTVLMLTAQSLTDVH